MSSNLYRVSYRVSIVELFDSGAQNKQPSFCQRRYTRIWNWLFVALP